MNALTGVLSEDEQITRQLLLNDEADVVVQVADARNLRRALILTSHIGELRQPMVLALNMIDEASERGISIDTKTLAGATRWRL